MEIHFIDKTNPENRLPDTDLALEIEHLRSARHSISFVLDLRIDEANKRLKNGKYISEKDSDMRHYYKETH